MCQELCVTKEHAHTYSSTQRVHMHRLVTQHLAAIFRGNNSIWQERVYVEAHVGGKKRPRIVHLVEESIKLDT